MGLGLGPIVQRYVIPDDAKGVAVWALVQAGGRRLGHRISLEAPDKETDTGNVIAALAAMGHDAAHIDGMGNLIKRPVEAIQRIAVSNVNGLATQRMLMIEMLSPAEQLVEFDGAGGPAGHVSGKQLEQRQRAFAPPIADGAGNVASGDHDSLATAASRGQRVRGL